MKEEKHPYARAYMDIVKRIDQLAQMLQTIDTRLASYILHSNAGCVCPPESEYPPASSWSCPVHGRMETE